MRILAITGNHPRHLHLVQILRHSGFDVLSVVMEREHFSGRARLNGNKLEMKHFEIRESVEYELFGRLSPKDYRDISVSVDDINKSDIKLDATELGAFDLCLVFGTTLLPPTLVNLLPPLTFNLHLGISPRYRGAATLFWPFYMLEPNWSGFTIHKLASEPDSGDVALRSVPALKKGMRMHDVAGAATLLGLEGMLKLAQYLNEFPEPKYHRQMSTGKNWLESDFREIHLKLIYEVMGDSIVDFFLEGDLGAIKSPITLGEEILSLSFEK